MSNQNYKRVELGKYIVADQAVCHGKPVFKGTRIIVSLVIERFASGLTLDEIAQRYQLPKEAIAEGLKLAAAMLHEHARLPAPTPSLEELLCDDQNVQQVAAPGSKR